MIASDRPRRRRGATALLLAVALTGVAACGDDENEPATSPAAPAATAPKAPPTVTLNASAQGKDNIVLEAPAEVAAGLVTLALKNADSRPREAQLVRVTGDQTVEQVLEIRESEDGGATPDWFVVAGGVATVAPGQTAKVTQTLAPGTYYAIDAGKDGPPDNPKIPSYARLGATARFVVTGPETAGELPEAPASISAREHEFEITGLKAGRNQVRFENTGSEPHHAILFPLLEGKTAADAVKFLESERPSGPPPVDFRGGTGTTALEGGTEQVAELELRAGKYAVVCFLTDRKGGKQHLAKGQVAEVTVG